MGFRWVQTVPVTYTICMTTCRPSTPNTFAEFLHGCRQYFKSSDFTNDFLKNCLHFKRGVILLFQTTELVNMAILTGHTQSWSLRIYSLSQAGHVTDITSQTTCHSGQEIVLKVRTSGFLSTRVHQRVYITNKLLPPANEVWGKVMFLHMSVILSTGGGGLCMMSLPVQLPGPMFLPEDLCPEGTLPEGSLFRGSCQGYHPDRDPPHMGKSGRYTSYWNAFLLSFLNWGTTF